MHERVTLDIFIQQDLPRAALASLNVRDDANVVIIRRQNVRAQITQTLPAVTLDDPGNDDVAGATPCQMNVASAPKLSRNAWVTASPSLGSSVSLLKGKISTDLSPAI